MSEPNMPQKAPYKVEVEEGKKYFWCSCGLSSKQPFCDGSHSTTDFKPVLFNAPETKAVFFCGCKKTAANPLCDGSHNKIG